jgi:EAL domain-containing protein (putative c-di-GMP-specific phosphodiesterase class I)/GGDEF domain-containing protein
MTITAHLARRSAATDLSLAQILLASASDLALSLDDAGIIQAISGSALSLIGRNASALQGQPVGELIAPDRRRSVMRRLSALKPGARLTPPLAFRLLCSGKTGPRVLALGGREQRRDGHIHLLLSILPQIRGSGRADAARDSETLLFEREDYIPQLMAQLYGARLAEAPWRLSLVDLYGFENLRTDLEEAVIDRLLAEIGAYIRGVSLGEDSGARLEEQRFALLHHQTLTAERLEHDLQTLLRRFHPQHRILVRAITLDLNDPLLDDREAAHTLAFTINRFSHAPETSLGLKHLSQGFTELMAETNRQIANFGQFILAGDFDLLYQPIVHLGDERLSHYEALARFQDGDDTAAKIGFVEQVGMVEEFDLTVIERVLATLAGHAHPITVAVNLSGRSLQNRGFVAALHQTLEASSVLAHRLIFELTETVDIARLEEVNATIQTLRQRGHSFCLDDFGAGASAFHYLRALNVDTVKIDGSYLRQLGTSARDSAFIRAIVSLCHELGIKTIAEMVETIEQRRLLTAAGVEYGQGFLFGYPAPLPP